MSGRVALLTRRFPNLTNRPPVFPYRQFTNLPALAPLLVLPFPPAHSDRSGFTTCLFAKITMLARPLAAHFTDLPFYHFAKVAFFNHFYHFTNIFFYAQVVLLSIRTGGFAPVIELVRIYFLEKMGAPKIQGNRAATRRIWGRWGFCRNANYFP